MTKRRRKLVHYPALVKLDRQRRPRWETPGLPLCNPYAAGRNACALDPEEITCPKCTTLMAGEVERALRWS